LLGVVLPRVVREGRRIVRHLIAFGRDSELPLKIAKAQADTARIDRALDRLPHLLEQAQAAALIIRTTPLVPPALGAVAARIGAEIRAFRAARS